MARRRPRLLVTGFNAFPGAPVNPTEALVVALRDQGCGFEDACRFRAELLDVDYRALPARLVSLGSEFQPDIAIHFGLSASARGFRLERLARNATSATSTDNSGYMPTASRICDGDDTHPSTLPLELFHDRLAAAGLPVEWSDSAGDYLCNFLFYHACGARVPGYAPAMAGFVHVPPFPAGSAADLSGLGGGTMDLDTLRRGAGIIIAACLEAWPGRG